MMRRLHPSSGFTLVELMIVVSIIALLAAIAIPNLARARLNANETAAISTLRTISTAEESYRAAQSPPDYGDFSELTAANPPYLTMTTTSATTMARQGYSYTLGGLDNNTFCVSTSPVTPNTTGIRTFTIDARGVILGGSGGSIPACSGATPFQGSGGTPIE